MTEDDLVTGLSQGNVLTGAPFEAVEPTLLHRVRGHHPSDGRRRIATSCGSSTTTTSDSMTGTRTTDCANPFAAPAAEPVFELHNLTTDPEERHNLTDDAKDAARQLTTVLDQQREAKRLVPSLRNP